MAELKFEIPEGIGEGLFSEPSGEGLRVLVEAVAQALINAQASAHFEAPWNAKGLPRPNGYRNGYKERGLPTVAGAVELSVPQARDGSFRPVIYDRWQQAEKAMLAACGEMVLAGASNRSASRLAVEAFGAGVSPSLIAHLVKELEPALEAFRARRLGTFRYLLVDARFDTIRRRRIGPNRRSRLRPRRGEGQSPESGCGRASMRAAGPSFGSPESTRKGSGRCWAG